MLSEETEVSFSLIQDTCSLEIEQLMSSEYLLAHNTEKKIYRVSRVTYFLKEMVDATSILIPILHQESLSHHLVNISLKKSLLKCHVNMTQCWPCE